MSYSFGMFFKQIKEKDVLSFFHQVSEIMIKNSTEVLDINKYYIPSVRSNKMNEYVDEYWLDTIFSLKFIYWEEKELLGMSGYNYPQELVELFDCHIGFQNSYDQDYDYNTWSDNITFFKQCKKLCINKTALEILQMYEDDKDWYTEKEIEEKIEYHKKSVLYNMIYKGLALDCWLYGKNDNCFKRYTINAIDCIEKKIDIHQQLKALIH